MYEALHTNLVSSDESDAEEDALKTRPLTWRTEEVTLTSSNALMKDGRQACHLSRSGNV